MNAPIRRALIEFHDNPSAAEIADRVRRVDRYIDNTAYSIGIHPGPILPPGILITGHDVAGWTLDGYVIPRLASGAIFAREIFHCTTCGSDTHNVDSCPDEVLVYAVKVDGEDYMHVADNDESLQELIGSEQSYGQCENCGGFGTLYSTSDEPKLQKLARVHGAQVFAVCQGCGTSYPVTLKRSKEVCF